MLAVAATNKKVINQNYRRVSELESNVHELLQHANKLAEDLNDALQNVNKLNKYLHRDQALNLLQASLNSVLAINEVIIENFVDGVSSRITTNLFPVEDLT